MERFMLWLNRYADAWRVGDADAIVGLFTPDAEYQDAPFSEPFHGQAAIRDYWAQAARHTKRDVEYEAQRLAESDEAGLAHWHAEFTAEPGDRRVELDGILMATIGDDGRCSSFREWWHRLESQPD
jgi:ketosteroid isomerase-like protein